MELAFTVITIVLLGSAYLLVQRFRGSAALSRRSMSEWLLRFEAASPVEQHEMAEALLTHSVRLAAQMGVQASIAELLATGNEASALVATWQSQLHTAMPTTSLSTTPARTIGALMVIRQVQPLRFQELLGQSTTI
ncbi:hypothetical protein [Phytopseudomonas daroniae]|nr:MULTISPECIES: hypothetical protein [Pseudomonas]